MNIKVLIFLLLLGSFSNKKSVTVPFVLDHNRMLVEAEFQRKDGTWRKVRLWVDSGSTEFFISESLARDLGIDLSVSFYGQAGNKILNRKRGEVIWTSDGNMDADLAVNRWHGEGTSDKYPSSS
mgnify:CR=1 FL=1